MFMVSNLLHFSFGAWLLDHQTRLATIWKVPSVLATLAGRGVGALGLEVWPPLLLAIRMVGDIAIPLMLFSLGVRLTDGHASAWRLGEGYDVTAVEFDGGHEVPRGVTRKAFEWLLAGWTPPAAPSR